MMVDSNTLVNLPKIELHCHLDGSIRPELAQQLLAARGEQYALDELRKLMQAPVICNDLSEYLRYFDLPNEILQQPQELEAAAYDLAMSAAQEGVRYLEVRFAPYFSTAEGLSVGQVLEAVIKGLERAKRVAAGDRSLRQDAVSGKQLHQNENIGIESRVIVCGMRGLSEQVNLSMLRASAEFLGQGVAACDLAGDEKYYPLKNYAYFFEEAKRLDMPFTIHAGECGSRENIRMAIELGASRIGHGIAMYRDRELQELCAQRRIGVELCPTSNLQTQAISSFRNYPLMEFMAAGVPVSVNTDNRTVSATTLTAELGKLAEEFPELAEDFARDGELYRRIYRNSVEMSFAPDEVKHRLLAQV